MRDDETDILAVGEARPCGDAAEGCGPDASAILPDPADPAFVRHMRRVDGRAPAVRAWHAGVAVMGAVLGAALLCVPAASDRAARHVDGTAAEATERAVDAMGDGERRLRLALAQGHNAQVVGWDGWDAISDNEGRGGAAGSADADIADLGDASIPELAGEAAGSGSVGPVAIDSSDPLDVGGGAIGVAILPTGRSVVMVDHLADSPGDAATLRHERWSEWPVGGLGCVCVLSLDGGGQGVYAAGDLSAMGVGDRMVLRVLGDSYAYEVDRAATGPRSGLLAQATRTGGSDRVSVIFDDGSGAYRMLAARRVRHGGEAATSPASARDSWDGAQAVVAVAVAVIASVAFVVAWRRTGRAAS